MWFKNIQLFRLSAPIKYSPEALENQLQRFAFSPCLPSFEESVGWHSPLDLEDSPLTYAANGYLMFCLQIEKKLLPATVIRQKLAERIKEIEQEEQRPIRAKEKRDLKDDIIVALRPRAFSQYTKIYAYIDTKKQLLILNTCTPSRADKFTHLFKRTFDDLNLVALETKKPGHEMTQWLQHNKLPGALHIEKSCVLQDPEQQNRIIRCQQQNLFASSIQSLVKDGCQVKQLGLSFDEDLSFILDDNFHIRSIRYQEELLAVAKETYAETPEQQFDADFVLMTEALDQLIEDLLKHFEAKQNKEKVTEPA